MNEITVITPSDSNLLRNVRDKFVPDQGQEYYKSFLSQLADRLESEQQEIADLSEELQRAQSKPEYNYAFDNGVRAIYRLVQVKAQEIEDLKAMVDLMEMQSLYAVEEIKDLTAKCERLQKLVTSGWEYAIDLAGEWSWKRDTIQKNIREMSELDTFIKEAEKTL